eukprot:15439867-Heterocapsa_arctica.AAC.1
MSTVCACTTVGLACRSLVPGVVGRPFLSGLLTQPGRTLMLLDILLAAVSGDNVLLPLPALA